MYIYILGEPEFLSHFLTRINWYICKDFWLTLQIECPVKFPQYNLYLKMDQPSWKYSIPSLLSKVKSGPLLPENLALYPPFSLKSLRFLFILFFPYFRFCSSLKQNECLKFAAGIDLKKRLKKLKLLSLFRLTNVCPRSSAPFHIVSYYIQWGTTSWI